MGREEYWIREEDGCTRRVHVPVGHHEVVEVAYELLAQMLTDLGWVKEDDA